MMAKTQQNTHVFEASITNGVNLELKILTKLKFGINKNKKCTI